MSKPDDGMGAALVTPAPGLEDDTNGTRRTMDAEKMKEIAERVARHMRARGYSTVEVNEGEVHARTEVMLGDRLYEVPVVLTIEESRWTYEVDDPGHFGNMFDVAPGGIVTPELARAIVEGWWRALGLDEEYETWLSLMAERGPGEEPPTMEKVRAVVERDEYFEVETDIGTSS